MRILLIEDDETIVETIKNRLRKTYAIDTATTGERGKHLAEVCDYDLILLDLNLPDAHGSDICQALRNNRVRTPIMILTGQHDIADKVDTLDSGADDYLTKPFSFAELNARIRALLRRNPEPTDMSLLTAADLSLDPVRRIVIRGDKVIRLRRKEFNILEYLLRNKGKVVKRQMILDHVWDDETNAASNIVDVHVKYLRDFIDKPFSRPLIRTIHGVGYKIES